MNFIISLLINIFESFLRALKKLFLFGEFDLSFDALNETPAIRVRYQFFRNTDAFVPSLSIFPLGDRTQAIHNEPLLQLSGIELISINHPNLKARTTYDFVMTDISGNALPRVQSAQFTIPEIVQGDF